MKEKDPERRTSLRKENVCLVQEKVEQALLGLVGVTNGEMMMGLLMHMNIMSTLHECRHCPGLVMKQQQAMEELR